MLFLIYFQDNAIWRASSTNTENVSYRKSALNAYVTMVTCNARELTLKKLARLYRATRPTSLLYPVNAASSVQVTL